MDPDCHTQVLREIDKLDKVGPIGVFARLTAGLTDTSGAAIEGAGLTNKQALIIMAGIASPISSSPVVRKVSGRIAMMVALEKIETDDTGYTAWDRLIDMPVNDDETWSEGRRPRNIGWALDDIVALLRRRND